jgi:hypothetical protein
MNDFIVNAPYNSLFIIYLLISCNFLAQLFGCKLQTLLNNNMYVKHLFGFLTMLFCIILVDSSIQKEFKYFEGFVYAIIFYIWFWSTTKTDIKFTIVIIIIFMIIYLIQLNKNSLTESKEDIKQKKYLANSQFFLAIISLLLTIFGVGFYVQNKQNEYKEKWSIKKFIFGVPKCLEKNS